VDNSIKLECEEQKKTQVVYFTNYSSLYGANRSLLEMLQVLRNYRIEPIVITPVYGEINKELDRISIKNKTLYFRSWICSSNDILIKKILKLLITYIVNSFSCIYIYRFLKGQHIDLIHTNSSVINIGALVSEQLQIPHIWHIREYGEEDYNIRFLYPFKRAVQFILEKSKKIVFISRDLMLKYEPYMDNDSKSIIIYNGAKKDKYYSIKESNPDVGTFRIVCCGLIQPNKNQMEVLKAIQILVNEKKIKNLELILVGDGSKQYINMLHDYVDRYKLHDYVKFNGYTNNVADIIKTCSIGVVPSRREAFGRVTIEYMLAGLPVIASNTGANSEIIEDGKTGYIYELNNPIDLSEKIKLLYTDRNQLLRFSKYAQKKALNEFTADINAKKIYELYQQVL